MRLFAALGPGDIVAAHRTHLLGAPIVSVTSITFSGQLFEYCRARGITGLFTSHNGVVDQLETLPVRFVNVPRRWEQTKGWRFHVSRIVYAVRLARMARSFGADLALIDSGSAHYFSLAIFPLMGVSVAVCFHNVRWPQGFEPRRWAARAIRAADSWFFRSVAVGAIGCSPECGIQARLDGANRLPYFGFCAQFRAEGFARRDIKPVGDTFHLMFAGRIEREKGVFDLILVSNILRYECKVPVAIDVYGDGGALAELRAAVRASGQEDRVTAHGKRNRIELLHAYQRAHAIIVPTRSCFCEGMPLVCAEAVLSGLPVVTSRLSNAIPVIGAAIAEAQPDDVTSYARVISRLAEDNTYYRQLGSACVEVSRQFLDRDLSYPAAVDRLIGAILPVWKVLGRFDQLFEAIG